MARGRSGHRYGGIAREKKQRCTGLLDNGGATEAFAICPGAHGDRSEETQHPHGTLIRRESQDLAGPSSDRWGGVGVLQNTLMQRSPLLGALRDLHHLHGHEKPSDG